MQPVLRRFLAEHGERVGAVVVDIARENDPRAARFRGGDDRIDPQIGLRRQRLTDSNSLVRLADVVAHDPDEVVIDLARARPAGHLAVRDQVDIERQPSPAGADQGRQRNADERGDGDPERPMGVRVEVDAVERAERLELRGDRRDRGPRRWACPCHAGVS